MVWAVTDDDVDEASLVKGNKEGLVVSTMSVSVEVSVDSSDSVVVEMAVAFNSDSEVEFDGDFTVAWANESNGRYGLFNFCWVGVEVWDDC